MGAFWFSVEFGDILKSRLTPSLCYRPPSNYLITQKFRAARMKDHKRFPISLSPFRAQSDNRFNSEKILENPLNSKEIKPVSPEKKSTLNIHWKD